MKGIKVVLKEAQKVKSILRDCGLIDNSKNIKKKNGFIFFPIKNSVKVKKLIKNAEIVDEKFKKIEKTKSLKKAVEKKLTKKELKKLKTSFDVVGSIAILEIDKELEKKEKFIAETLIKINPKIKTVLKKEGHHEGVFRTQKMKFLAGDDTRETVHRENGVSIKINVENVYFSVRLSTERKRISELVKPGEKILVMFSGAAPYVCVIAKNSKASEIVGVEINPLAHKYALENLKINKIKNARLYLGDVREIVPELKEKFDRIIMPLPKSAGDFLDIALSSSKKGTVIHFYDFLHEEEMPKKAVEKIEKACKKAGLNFRVLHWNKCGQYTKKGYRVCVDFKIV